MSVRDYGVSTMPRLAALRTGSVWYVFSLITVIMFAIIVIEIQHQWHQFVVSNGG